MNPRHLDRCRRCRGRGCCRRRCRRQEAQVPAAHALAPPSGAQEVAAATHVPQEEAATTASCTPQAATAVKAPADKGAMALTSFKLNVFAP